MGSHRPHLGPALILLMATALVATAYFPALSGVLVFDDYAHVAPLYRLPDPHTLAALWEGIWSSNSGPTGRPVAMFTLALQVLWLGADIATLKITNLIIHLGVGLLLFLLARGLLRLRPTPRFVHGDGELLAAAAAALWTIHPLQLTSVAYTIQRMNSLSALFVVAALVVYVHARRRGDKALRHALPGIAVLWILGLLSKENAVLLPIYILALEATVLWRNHPIAALQRLGNRAPRWTWLLALSALALAGAVAALHYAPGFASRPFTLAERLMTEPRIVLWYLSEILAPRVSGLGLYHDDWTLSRGLLSPPSTLGSLVTVTALLVVALWRLRAWPVFSFGVLWFFGGHLLESTFLPLELVFEHRNYLPSFGPLLAVTVGAAGLAARLGPRGRIILWAGLAVYAGTFGYQTHQRAERWATDPTARLEYLTSRTGSMRSMLLAAEIHLELAAAAEDKSRRDTHLDHALALYQAAAARFGPRPEILVGEIMALDTHGRPEARARIDALIRALPGARVSATVSNGLRSLTLCATGGHCPTVRERLPELLQSAWAHPQADRARILELLARYEADVAGHLSEAIRLQRAAVAHHPEDLDARIRYVMLLGRAGDRATALTELAEIARRDRLGITARARKRLRLAILGRHLERDRVKPTSTIPPHEHLDDPLQP